MEVTDDQTKVHETLELDFDDGAAPEEASAKTGVEKAIEELATVDAKMFRKSLDMLALARSSNIRLALTRIFRGAMDEEELSRALDAESEKIVSPEDQRQLRRIKKTSTIDFLNSIIELLHDRVFK